MYSRTYWIASEHTDIAFKRAVIVFIAESATLLTSRGLGFVLEYGCEGVGSRVRKYHTE